MKTACYNILIKEMEVMSMKNKKMKSGGLLTLAFLMAAGNVMPALAGSWQQDAAGWRWKNDDGSYHAGSWQWLDGNRDGVSECYYFGKYRRCLGGEWNRENHGNTGNRYRAGRPMGEGRRSQCR